MVDFRDRKSVTTRNAILRVDPGLPAGSYLFELTVVDGDGNRSKPMRLNVEIVERGTVFDPRLVTPISPVPAGPVPIGPRPIIRGPN
jgi:hypothetical protein